MKSCSIDKNRNGWSLTTFHTFEANETIAFWEGRIPGTAPCDCDDMYRIACPRKVSDHSRLLLSAV